LETAKEEMQSTNEELETVNEELRHANLEANSVNNDLINLLASVQIPLVMVDSNLCIRRFTPAAQKFFSLIPTDLGRSLSDIKANFDAAELDKMILGVMDTLHLRESEVCDHDGRWHLLRVRPYRTKDNKIDGAVVALFDIDQLKRSLEQITDLIWSPFLALDRQLHVVRANEPFYRMFRVTREETEGRFIYELGNGQWNIPRLRVLLEELLPHNTVIKDFSVAHEFPKIGPRKMLLNARRLNADESRKEMILLAVQDLPRKGKDWP
jgi:two-component system CheB/CheR fusion protein